MAAPTSRPENTLANLLGDLAGETLPDVAVTDISQTAQEVVPGSLFLACAGTARHGLEFADEAISRGATAIAWEPSAGASAPGLPDGITGVSVPGLREATGIVADRFFGQPSASLHVAGITGTNGKTSTAFFVAQALETLGPGCGIIGTLGSGRPGNLKASLLTTPDAVGVHRQLAGFRDDGIRHVVMEVSSHALVQGRVNAVRFECAGFTNLSRDHLDYHGDMNRYALAKTELFTRFTPGHAVINCGDPAGARIAAATPQGTHRILIAAPGSENKEGDWLSYGDIDAHESGITFQVKGSYGAARLHSRLVGEFNAGNLLVALGILLCWGFSFRESIRALENVSAPAGRMETFRNKQGPLVVVDYAHTPDALEKVLLAARAHARGKLLLVFGCGGERDPGKRPEMGRIAARLADEIIVTDDNPRNEDPDAIVDAIVAGAGSQARVIRDRAAAIESAIAVAGEGDVVIVAGKGHESYQTTAAGRQPFSDRAVVSGLLGIVPRAQEVSA
ncbi:MAG: UDP-N-acetylmuramoyl-L-alanyl-D-glutamate--2,6-diaminopimelate ligase [Gammaproteobacteria bacterium]|nr:UDP-N-acetylmuramoyl-L-alanyl-D-glutamate--2,6-diaminopimelate ligase [Gammaproteobacteria bacterium]